MDRLPIFAIEPDLVAACAEHQRLILEAPTGSGKSTQVPQMLLDNGLVGEGQIVVLQPRRVAARLLARRVAEERGVRLGEEVGYHIRLDRKAGPRTRIKYVTEGTLLRQMVADPELRGIDAILFDEFHERHLDGDVTLGRAIQIQRERRPDLRLLVMSATLETGPLREFLSPCAELSTEGRTFPVEVEYIRRDDQPVWDLAAHETERLLAAGAEGDVLVFMPGAYEIQRTIQALRVFTRADDTLILPLHGELPADAQDAAVAKAEKRKIIVATNVAETSLTIDGVRIVIDGGLARIPRFDPHRGINTLLVEKISQASAEQRAGRAGRTAPGRCVRLWTERDHRERPAQLAPEIHRLDLSETALALKGAGITDLRAFDWLEPPGEKSLTRAETLLDDLGALAADGSLTETGRRMLSFPMHPRYARMLLAANELGCVRPAALIAALSQGRPLFTRGGGKRVLETRADVLGDEAGSDFFILMRAWRFAANRNFNLGPCKQLGIHAGAAAEVGRVLNQFLDIAEAQGLDVSETKAEEDAIGRAILAGFADQLAVRVDEGTLRCRVIHGRTGMLQRESVVRDPRLLVASEISEVQGGDDLRVLLSNVTAVEESWLKDMFPEAFHEVDEVAFDPDIRRVVALRQRRFRDLVLEEKSNATPDPDAAARILAEEVLAGRCPLKAWDYAVEQWIERVNSLREWMPELELPLIDATAQRAMLEQILHGAYGVKEVKDRPVWGVIKDWLAGPQQAALDSYAPERFPLPGGRKAKVTYRAGEPPTLGARIQDLYGVESDLTVAGGKVRVKVQVLAPNHRPVQVTDNLTTFWKESYPKLKQELSRRYPKHEWR